jgi:excisionase family DNA binding protein
MPRITKEQAAEILNMTTRAVERYTKQNRLSATYERGRTRPVPTYDEAEVRALAASLLHPAQPAISNSDRSDNSDRDVVIPPSQALERAGGEQGIAMFAPLVADALAANLAQGNGIPRTLSPADLAHKLTLSITEAAALAGLSANHLREAIKAGKLKAKIVGRGYKVRPDYLRAYVAKVLK